MHPAQQNAEHPSFTHPAVPTREHTFNQPMHPESNFAHYGPQHYAPPAEPAVDGEDTGDEMGDEMPPPEMMGYGHPAHMSHSNGPHVRPEYEPHVPQTHVPHMRPEYVPHVPQQHAPYVHEPHSSAPAQHSYQQQAPPSHMYEPHQFPQHEQPAEVYPEHTFPQHEQPDSHYSQHPSSPSYPSGSYAPTAPEHHAGPSGPEFGGHPGSYPTYPGSHPSYPTAPVEEVKPIDFIVDLRESSAKADLETTGIMLEVGMTAKFILAQNITTGYKWVTNPDADMTVFSVEEADQSDHNPHHYTGVGGSKTITIECLTVGVATLEAVKLRKWESAPLDTLTVEITCNAATVPVEDPVEDPETGDEADVDPVEDPDVNPVEDPDVDPDQDPVEDPHAHYNPWGRYLNQYSDSSNGHVEDIAAHVP